MENRASTGENSTHIVDNYGMIRVAVKIESKAQTQQKSIRHHPNPQRKRNRHSPSSPKSVRQACGSLGVARDRNSSRLKPRVLGLGDQRRKPHRAEATKKLISLCNPHFVQRQFCQVAVTLLPISPKRLLTPFLGWWFR